MDDAIILAAISFTAPSTFSEFCKGLGTDMPSKGATAEWRELFQSLERLERERLVVIERHGNSIESLQLTPQGADRVRAVQDLSRPLFNL